MKIFIVGDHRTGTGPANVTKEYIRCLDKEALYQKMTGKIARVPELFFKIIRSDVILFSGYSAQNVLGMKIASIFNKKTAYLVHGAITHENRINQNENEKMSQVEEETLRRADLLLGVSEKFSNWLKEEYPQYIKKIDYVTNGVDFDYLRNLCGEESNIASDLSNNRKKNQILSVGGGMPRKMILNICKAIEIYNENVNDSDKLKLYVIGADGIDTEKIKGYSFVEYLGMVSSDEKAKLYKESYIFIQNSSFETFGLAVFEALISGSNILTSKVAGALDLLKDARDEDIINDYSNPLEIADKIRYLMDNPNVDRLKAMINEKDASWESRTMELKNKLEKLMLNE